jgi:hypothetical protein
VTADPCPEQRYGPGERSAADDIGARLQAAFDAEQAVARRSESPGPPDQADQAGQAGQEATEATAATVLDGTGRDERLDALEAEIARLATGFDELKQRLDALAAPFVPQAD